MTTLKIDKGRTYSVDRVVSQPKSMIKPIVEQINRVGILVDNTLASKLEHLKFNLYRNIRAQDNIQDSMAYLDDKEENLTKLKNLGENLMLLSSLYSRSSPYSDDRIQIVKSTEALLKEIETLTLKIDSKLINLISSTGREGTLYSNDLKIHLTLYPYLSDNKFINSYKTNELLSNSSLIKDNIISPVDTLIDECQNYKSSLYNQFLEENSLAQYNIDELYRLKDISYYMWQNLQKTQEYLLNSGTNLRFQTNNLSPDNVYELLK
ncbi:MAG: hypothetical protein RR539_04485 [Clostridium sp.]|uniref:hypothetical protein n=1 Tax=Clostridium sp. TaxID=1506 RepID=UPI002FCB2A0C